ncbi:hypothetical protein CBL_07843 [Carabus blaptoides fortunei]
MDPDDVQPPANLQEINRGALNFRKLMLLFPYLHPATLHGVIVKYNFNWELILPMLFASQGARAEQFWDEVNGPKELEYALERYGVRLVCCNGFKEDQCFGIQSLDELDEPQNTHCHPRHERDCIHITIEQSPQQGKVPKTVCELGMQNNDVIRIILGENNEGLVEKNAPKTLEIVRNDSATDNQSGYIIRNVTNTAESIAKPVQNVKTAKRTRQRAKTGEKKSRCRKPKLTNTNEQNKTCSGQVEHKTALASSKKGKATSNTRVKSSKNTTNTH